MNKQRLLKLADFLHSLKESDTKQFDMGVWGTAELIQTEKAEPIEIDPASCGCKIEKKEVFECKTTACALGWATQIPSFQKAGLKMEWDNTLDEDGFQVSGHPVLHEAPRADPFTIAEKFFDLSSSEAQFLFSMDGGHSTPKETARVIRKVVEKGLKAARGW